MISHAIIDCFITMTKINATALIIDDEQDIRELIEMAFSSLGISCVLSPTVTDGIRQLKKQADTLDFCITDMRLPDGDGLDLVAHIQKNYPQLPVCVITAHGNVELAVKALKRGAFDFVNKPFDLKQLRAMAKAALKLSNSQDSKTENQSISKKDTEKVRLIGESVVMKKLDSVIGKLARSQAPVFIHGESGTGKELVARSIHEKSARQDGAFVPVNCGAIPENLVESEFFGYKKGAFTGANNDHDGLFVSASGGTLFLDEVADLPLSMQVKLLRAIQERAIRPIGGDKEIPVDVRILSATHKNLNKLVADNEFREDLYYRLNVISLGMPPLRKRHGDVKVLAMFILNKMAVQQDREVLQISDEAIAKLNTYEFPGNVRELENILERAVTFCEDNTLDADDIQFSNRMITDEEEGLSIDLTDGLGEELEEHLNNHDAASYDLDNDDGTDDELLQDVSLETVDVEQINDLDGYIADVERKVIVDALEANKRNKTTTAEKLGVSLRTLRYKLKKYDIS